MHLHTKTMFIHDAGVSHELVRKMADIGLIFMDFNFWLFSQCTRINTVTSRKCYCDIFPLLLRYYCICSPLSYCTVHSKAIKGYIVFVSQKKKKISFKTILWAHSNRSLKKKKNKKRLALFSIFSRKWRSVKNFNLC